MIGIRPNAVSAAQWSRSSCTAHRCFRPTQDRYNTMLNKAGEIMLTSSRIKHLTASHVPCSAFSLLPAGKSLFLKD